MPSPDEPEDAICNFGDCIRVEKHVRSQDTIYQMWSTLVPGRSIYIEPSEWEAFKQAVKDGKFDGF